jgi:hypothetical protein
MTYMGYDVLEVEPSADQPLKRTYTRDMAVLDATGGRITSLDTTGVATVDTSPFRWMMLSRADIDAYRTFRAARCGQLVPFWVPTWRRDLLIAVDLAPESTALVIEACTYTQYCFPQPARRYLAFLFPDGSKYYRKVTAAVALDALRESLTLDAGLPVFVPRSTRVSFLTLCRQAVDDAELVWTTTTVAEADLEFLELPQEVPA